MSETDEQRLSSQPLPNDNRAHLLANYSTESIRIYLKERLLDRLKTGDPLWDAIIGITIISSQDTITSHVAALKNLCLYMFRKIYQYFYHLYLSKKEIIVKPPTFIEKVATVRYITEDRSINYFYEPVMWFLTNNTVIVKENRTELTGICIGTSNGGTGISVRQQIPKGNVATISFLDHQITYRTHTEMVTIYGDREYKRENNVITLTTYVDPLRQEDIFEQFSTMCVTKHSEWKKKLEWQQQIYRYTGSLTWSMAKSSFSRKLNTVVLKENQMEELVNDLNDFLQKEEWYQSRGIPYTRHYMFYGCPGSGKSSCIKALAGHTKRHLHYLILSEVKSDAELLTLMEQLTFSQTILVIEDIDCASDIVTARTKEPVGVDEKEDTAEKTAMTLSGLLNAIDGSMSNSHGRILIMTTNHPEKLDPALVRPGRVDRKFLFDNCNYHQIEGLFFNFFNRNPPSKLDFAGSPKTGSLKTGTLKTVSPAEVTGVFLQYKNDPDEAWRQLQLLFKDEQAPEITSERPTLPSVPG